MTVKDPEGYAAEQKEQVNQFLYLIYGLLGLSVIIAILGVVNTLSLSVIERTREVGLLRAVGVSRRQLRTMIRLESVVVAVFGGVLGMVLGVAFGSTLVTALEDDGLTELAIPWPLAGRLPGRWRRSSGCSRPSFPARRAARLDVLKAIGDGVTAQALARGVSRLGTWHLRAIFGASWAVGLLVTTYGRSSRVDEHSPRGGGRRGRKHVAGPRVRPIGDRQRRARHPGPVRARPGPAVRRRPDDRPARHRRPGRAGPAASGSPVAAPSSTKPLIDMQMRLSAYTEEMERRGKMPESRTLLARRESAGPGVARALEIEEGDRDRCTGSGCACADSVPMAIQHVYLSLDLFPNFLERRCPRACTSGSRCAT